MYYLVHACPHTTSAQKKRTVQIGANRNSFALIEWPKHPGDGENEKKNNNIMFAPVESIAAQILKSTSNIGCHSKNKNGIVDVDFIPF